MIVLRPLLLAAPLGRGGFNALNRATLGRLASHSSSPITNVETAFNTGDWTAPSGNTISLNTGRLRISAAGTNVFLRHTRYTAIAARADAMLQYLTSQNTTGASMGGGLRVGATPDPPDDFVMASFPLGFTDAYGISDWTDGIEDQTDETATTGLSQPQRVTLSVQDGVNPQAYFHGPGVEHTLGGGTAQTSGHASLYYSSGAANNLDYQEFYLMSNRYLTVNGPTTNNWKAELRNAGASLLATANASGGVATIDTFAARIAFPDAVTLQIRNLSDNLLLSATPTERLWGGDVWNIT